MNSGPIFISYGSKDADLVRELRVALEAVGLPVWVDSRGVRGGAKLAPEVADAIEQAGQFIVVISPDTINSPWVRQEIQKATEIRLRKGEGYSVVPLLLTGVEPSALGLWFDDEPVFVSVENKAGGISVALPHILAALGERLPADAPQLEVATEPIEELVLILRDARMRAVDGIQRVTATASVVYEPADRSVPAVHSNRFRFVAPLGPIETTELQWYLERYPQWPIGPFRARALQTEVHLSTWGQSLYTEVLGMPGTESVLRAWLQTGERTERRFSIMVDPALELGRSEPDQQEATQAAAILLSLPWELMHDGRGFLFQGTQPVLVRRRLPARSLQKSPAAHLPLRVLLVNPRPGNEQEHYTDHRASALPLVAALEPLGELAILTVLTPPTFPGLEQTLRNAEEREEPFDVLHLDSHSVFDDKLGATSLCFEDPRDVERVNDRGIRLVSGREVSSLVSSFRIPLVFLDASESAKSELAPSASLPATLLEAGVTSVVAMSYGITAEGGRRFVKAFYEELAQGKRIGTAMLAGRRELHSDSFRGRIVGAGELRMQDWFVPVLYQEAQDPQLIMKLPPERLRELRDQQRRSRLAALPSAPVHEFQGRSRELLTLERMLSVEPYVVIRGQSGTGKTTLAVELASWLVRTNRFRRAVFISLEEYADAVSALTSLGQQLLPNRFDWSVESLHLKPALEIVLRALRESPTIIVLDNAESVIQARSQPDSTGTALAEDMVDLFKRLMNADDATRLVFTTRERLPPPFDNQRREMLLGSLNPEDAVRLVGQVMALEGVTLKADDPAYEPEVITDLVESVDCHPRTLVLLAREMAHSGARATTETLHQLIADLDAKHPGERENSLYASVALSLRRLPLKALKQINTFGVFHGGAHLAVVEQMLEIDRDEVLELAREMIEVGIAEATEHGHLRLNPALPAYLLRDMTEGEQERLRERWAQSMMLLTDFLYEHQFKNAEVASRLTLLELPNLMALLEWMAREMPAEETVRTAWEVEALLTHLGRPRARLQVVKLREAAAQNLSEWSHARYLSMVASIDRLEEQGNSRAACSAARDLLQRCIEKGESAYAGADYDIALACLTLGRLLGISGAAEAGLEILSQAQKRFEALAARGDATVERMISIVISERGDLLSALGRLDEAAEAYEQLIVFGEKRGDLRSIAVNRGQLGRVHLFQGRHVEALRNYAQARSIFEKLAEPGSLAVTWHQTGLVQAQLGRYEEAEDAYRKSLSLTVQLRNDAGQAGSLHALGSLYSQMDRNEEAVSFYRQSADIYVRLQDIQDEGRARNNLAIVLMRLKRYDEARSELRRAIECKKPYGHQAELWKSWSVLSTLEQVTGNKEAAASAREQAMESYRRYRLDGGAPQSQGATLCTLVGAALQTNDAVKAEEIINQIQSTDAQRLKPIANKLLSILKGDHSPELASDPDLDYAEAVEVQLLLTGLENASLPASAQDANA